MKISTAKKRAGKFVHIYKQGKGWIVSIWDDKVRAWRLSNEVSYWTAVEWRKEVIDRIADEIMENEY